MSDSLGSGTDRAGYALEHVMARIQIYTTRWCGYCVRAKALLDAKGLAYEEIPLDDDPAFRQRIHDLTGGWTVPQILIDGDADRRLHRAPAPRARRPARRAPRRLRRLARWHVGQNHVPRPPTRDFAIGVPQRSHGSPPRPYTLNSFCIAPLAAVRQRGSRGASSPAARCRARARRGSRCAAAAARCGRCSRPGAADGCARARAPRRRRCSRGPRACAGRGARP